MNGESALPPEARFRSSKPMLDNDDLTELLRKRYGIRVARLKEFESYDDRTYYVETGDRSEFIAKVLNSTSTASEGLADTLVDLVDHLRKYPELKCQFIVPNLNGNLLSYEEIPNDVRDGDILLGRETALSALRLFNFVPGKPMSAFPPFPSTFYFEVGTHLGRLQLALKEYPGDVESLKVNSKTSWWCLSNVPWLRSLLPLVLDVKKRRLVAEIINQFEVMVVPAIPGLRKGVVHGDFNQDNVLVTSSVTGTCDRCGDNARPTSGVAKYQIAGVVDFDDTMYSYLVFEIAIAMMYAMYCGDEPTEAALYTLAGFETVSPLPSNERALLKVLVGGRFAQSLVLSLVQSKNHPNNEYVGLTRIKGWRLLEKWWGQPDEHLNELLDWVKARCEGQH